MYAFLSHPIVKGALAGALAAATVDFNAFRAWKDYRDAVTYQWGTAAFRWGQGAFFGAMSALGLGAAGL